MNSKIKEAWLKKLRSPMYENRKGLGYLRQDAQDMTRWDALGLLCEVYVDFKPPGSTHWSYSPDIKCHYFLGEYDRLPMAVAKWASLSSQDPILEGKALSLLSDEDNMSFADIADLIEKHL